MIFLNIVYKFINTNYFFSDIPNFDFLKYYHDHQCQIKHTNQNTQYYLLYLLSKIIFSYEKEKKIKKFDYLNELLENIFLSNEIKEFIMDFQNLLIYTNSKNQI